MAHEADLRGQRILVVEDDYYLATDAARAFDGAGAHVVGPCPSVSSALAAIEESIPTGAVVDINLGAGPSFEIAYALQDRAIPFVFITGYDEEIIPSEFANVPRLQKPVEPRRAVKSVATALGIDDGAPLLSLSID